MDVYSFVAQATGTVIRGLNGLDFDVKSTVGSGRCALHVITWHAGNFYETRRALTMEQVETGRFTARLWANAVLRDHFSLREGMAEGQD